MHRISSQSRAMMKIHDRKSKALSSRAPYFIIILHTVSTGPFAKKGFSPFLCLIQFSGL